MRHGGDALPPARKPIILRKEKMVPLRYGHVALFQGKRHVTPGKKN